jgi:hypothetical protein
MQFILTINRPRQNDLREIIEFSMLILSKRTTRFHKMLISVRDASFKQNVLIEVVEKSSRRAGLLRLRSVADEGLLLFCFLPSKDYL